MKIRPIKKSEFDELKRISKQAFVLNEERIDRWFTKDFDLSRTRALFVDGRMQSVLEIIPFQVWFNDKKMPMGGISGVASPPESRRKGYVRKLMEYSLKDMKERGFPISTLYPFSFDFYRKFGWEHASDWRVYSFDPKDLGEIPVPKGEMLRFSEKELKSVNHAYNEFSKTKTCSILREKKHWLERIMKSYEREMYSYLWRDYRGRVQGYIIYEIIDHGERTCSSKP
jgi:predicted acetyltransferase